MPSRRNFLIGAASLATTVISGRSASAQQARSGQAWESGDVVHLLPAANHERFLIKTSFRGPQRAAPVLLVDSRKISGRAGDTLGFFWTFDAAGLEPGARRGSWGSDRPRSGIPAAPGSCGRASPAPSPSLRAHRAACRSTDSPSGAGSRPRWPLDELGYW